MKRSERCNIVTVNKEIERKRGRRTIAEWVSERDIFKLNVKVTVKVADAQGSRGNENKVRKWPRGEGEERKKERKGEDKQVASLVHCARHDNAPLLGASDDLHLPHFLHQLCLLFYRRQHFQHLVIVFLYNNIVYAGRKSARVNRKLLLLSNCVKWNVFTLLHIHPVKVTLPLAQKIFSSLPCECIFFTGTNLLPLASIFIVIKRSRQFTRHYSPSHFYSSVADGTTSLSRGSW